MGKHLVLIKNQQLLFLNTPNTLHTRLYHTYTNVLYTREVKSITYYIINLLQYTIVFNTILHYITIHYTS